MKALDILEECLQRATLRWHASRTMFCPSCRNVLNSHKTVEIKWYLGDDEDPTLIKIRCTSCHDAIHELTILRTQKLYNCIRLEVLDGRKVFGNGIPGFNS